MEPDEIPCGVIGRPEQDHLSSTLASPKFTIPHTDNRTLHHINQHSPSSLSSPWSFSVSDPQQESERRADGVPSEGQYLQTGRFEWASGMDDDGHSTLMMVRSDPPPITMPVFRRALQLGSSQETWQGSNYSEEDAQVEVEEEEDDDEEEEGSVYTCIECSIYFKKKAHLLEHMFQHTQEGEGEGTQAGDGPHTCGECGKCFGEESSLTTHRQLHQESRQKIMEEIRKLESLADEGRSARLQCPKCLFGTNSSKVFVQHAKTHVKKGIGENRTTPSSFRTPAEMHEESSTEEVNDGIWNIAEKEAESEQDWGVDVPQAEEMQYPGKAKRKTPFKENTGDCTKDEQQKTGECCKTLKGSWIPEAAMEVKRKFREALKDGGLAEDGQRQQLREAVAVVVLENISSRKRRSKVSQPWGYSKRLSGEYSSKNSTSPFELQHSREEWAEDGDGDLPLDALLMDPSYEGQLEALGLRSEERECPYCPDRFHNGIGLANHVRGHLNRVGVSYNVRHFISAEEVKAIEQNYSFQKKRKKVLGSDEEDGTPLDLGRSQSSKQEPSRLEKMPSDQSTSRTEDPKAMDGEPGRDTDCQFCGAWFETRKGLSSHARAHLRHLGVTDPDAKGSPIAALNSLIKSEDFKKRLSEQAQSGNNTHTNAPGERLSTETSNGNIHTKLTETGLFTKVSEGKSADGAAKGSADGAHSTPADSMAKETSAHFKSPSGVARSTQMKILEAGVPHAMSSEMGTHVKTEARRPQNKLSEAGTHSKASLASLTHSRPQPPATPPAKKQKNIPSTMESFWASTNSSSPLNLSSRADPARDIRCEFCNEFFENRKGLSSHARSHLRQMGITEWHVNGSPIDTLREIIRKRRPPPPHLSNIKKEPRGEEPNSPTHTHSQHGMSTSGMAREMAISPLGRHNTFLSPLPAKRPPSHEPRLTQSEPKSYVHLEQKACNQSQAKAYVHGEARPKSYMHDESRPKAYVQSEGRPKSYIQGDGRPKVFMQGEGRPKTYMPGERPKPYGQSEIKHKPYSQNDGRPKPYMHGEGKPKGFLHGEGKPKGYLQGEGKLKAYAHIDGKPKAYIQTELPFKVKVKSSPDKAPTSLEACCELCGLYFENRKALASHARAHLRQFGVTEWCVNGSPIETLREWMKQRPQKAGAYLSYIQGGRPFTKKFKRSSQNPKAGAAEKESSICAVPGKMVEAERSLGTSGTVVEKSEGQGHKTERRPTKAAEVPPAREDSITESLPKAEEPRPAPRARPVPSLVPRPPQTSLVKFVGNIYTLKCRFCDIQFQGPLSIQEQWVRHLQHHILEMNFSKSPSPQALASPAQPEPTKAQ
ncbi:Wiz-like isoform X2 [Pelobates cultripes]|uniref:Wiz-like isoform X2 n=1 Tax=Pelobates cultripes TaxID=61616 RepID=A0AAD1RPA0_PELCU|nr:Wiz-like isoform X2 [Pelobates cultripes]